MVELYQGDFLFSTHDNLEHFALIEKCAGAYPADMLAKASSSVITKYFRRSDDDCQLRWPEDSASSSSRRHVEAMRPVAEHVREDDPNGDGLKEVLLKFLRVDPESRTAAKAALTCPYFHTR